MRRLLPLLAALALAAGCGGDGNGEGNGDAVGVTEPGPLATDICLGERGFELRPAASGVSAVSPGGVELTIAFFDTEEDAAAAAEGSKGGEAVANAVVTPSKGRLSQEELETIEACVRGD